jgi:hypothetical protein
MKRLIVMIALAAFAFLTGGTRAAFAEGAMAIGSTGDVAKDGSAYGGSYNYATRDAAIERALVECRKQSSQKAVARCELVTTFKRECYAVAEDPEVGTPGTGWALGPDKASAGERALASCKVTAGRDRQNKCVIEITACDEHD